jgi:hypothetical protein
VKSGEAVGAFLLASAICAAAYGLARYPGSAVVFVAFNLCFFGLAGLVIPRPRLYSYTFLAGFLLLGFWTKALLHAILAPPFAEPMGDFANTAREWDRALVVSACGALGLMLARGGHLWYARTSARAGEAAVGAAPDWFIRWRRPVWIFTLVLILGVNVANLQFAFFQIGINPKLTLPLRLHVVLGWLVNIGFALWLAALIWWDQSRDRSSLARTLGAPMLEACLSSVSSFSRLLYPLHAGAYWLAIFEHGKQLVSTIRRGSLVALIGSFFLLFALSILLVFALRVQHYYGYETWHSSTESASTQQASAGSGSQRSSSGAGDSTGVQPSEPLPSHVERTVKKQLPVLILYRWVGLEGVLTVGAIKNPSPALLLTALTESPKVGARSLYQRAAKAHVHYPVDSEKFTFLSNAGPVATLAFSGSLAIVFLGMALIGVVLVLTEEITRTWTGNPFLLAVSGAALASVVSQTTFFYLTLVFLAQTWIAVGFLAAVQRLRIPPAAVRAC